MPAKLADRIVDIASNHRTKRHHESSQESREYSQEPTYEVRNEDYEKSEARHYFKRNSAPMTLNEIVEKVKDRLRGELKVEGREKAVRIQANKLIYRPQNHYEDQPPEELQEDIVYEEPTYEIVNPKQTPTKLKRPVRPKRVDENQHTLNPKQIDRQRSIRHERQLSQDRVRPARLVIKPVENIPRLKPNYLKLKPRGHRIFRQDSKNGNKKIIKRFSKATPTTLKVVTEIPTNNDELIFETVDMRQLNDSYEDYVTPASVERFATEEEETTVANLVSYKPKINKAVTAESFVEEPMAEDIKEEIEDEPTEATTPEVKAKSISLSKEEKEIKTDANATTDASVKPKMKIGTMIPTRERFKLSSPNYYAKLPTIAEKYNFSEPIPAQDQEPENLKPIGAPPSNVNGKVISS
ncbi:unnamed protein product [Chrysodeixis includens]|uniref:Uncharacterized protein n=1 Tax=Chrysodeixis includens TaxID=689277 RepID=A0A9N8L6D7_CHRIL|nr:unnamed protein product [Chrysodeixis includens]